ncbi:MAG: hypothetical protein ACREID_09200 [Planctomycetota bacterium]
MKPLAVCRFLENKAYHVPPPPGKEEGLTPPSTPFWCAKTHDPVGPDGGDVRDDRCVRGRSCFRARVEL